MKAGFGAKGAALALGGQWGRYAIQIASLVVFSRLLDPAAFGRIAIITSITNIALSLGDFGLSMSALQRRDLSHAQRSNLVWINVAVGLFLCAILNLAAPLIASFFGQSDLESLCHVLSANFVLSGLGAQYKVGLNRQGRFDKLALSDVVGGLVAFGVALAAILVGCGAMSLALQQVVSVLVALIVIVVADPWLPSRPRRRVGMRPLVQFGGTLFLTYMANSLASNVDSIALGHFRPAAEVGVYNRAYQIARQPVGQMLTPLTRVAVPRAVRAGADPSTQLDSLIRFNHPVVTITAAGLSLMTAIGGMIGRLVLGGGWGDLDMIIALLAIGSLIQSSNQISYWLLLSSGNSRVLFLSEVLPRVGFVIAVCICARWGILAVIACVIAQQIAIVLASCLWALPRIGIAWQRACRASLGPTLFFLCLSCGIETAKQLQHSTGILSSLAPDVFGFLLWMLAILTTLALSRRLRATWFGYVTHAVRIVSRHQRGAPRANSNLPKGDSPGMDQPT